MEYSKLVEVYGELDSTTKRLEKTHIISEFIKKVDADELPVVMLLIEGRIFPGYDQREIGVASRIVLKALNTASGIPAERIENEWKKTGDLGIVAENLIKGKKQATLHSRSLTVAKVFENLRKLATLEGQGTVERKLQLIAELLTSSKPEEAKYVIRTILGNMRIGVGEGAMRDAIVWAFFGKEIGFSYDKKENNFNAEDREKYNKYANAVQHAYDVTNDFGPVAKTAKLDGLEGLEELELAVGVPIKVMLALKAETIEDAFKTVGKPAASEFKYDGFRCITGHTPIYVNPKGVLSIKDVKIGDKVLTHNGNFRRVVALNRRTINKGEKLYEIQTFLGNMFRISEKHPLLVFRNDGFRWVEIDNITKAYELAFPIPKLKAKSELCNKLTLTDESGYKKSITINKFFFRFLGFWIGDGFTNEYHNTERVGLIFNQKKDRKLCAYYRRNIIKNFKLSNLSENVHNGAIYLYWRDKPFRIWISKNFRREWKGKMLPYWFCGISKNQFDEFIRGWIESDGYKDKFGRISITTKERDLAMFAQLLALKFKRVIGVNKIRISNATYYRLIIPRTEKKSRVFKNYLLSKIFKLEQIKRPDPRTALYNMQVKGDESYCTAMVALHNCQIHKKDNNEIKIFTRRLEDVTNQFPDVVDYIKNHVKGNNFIVDSEAVGMDKKTGKCLPFQNISQRIKRKYDIGQMSKDFPVELNIFDLIYYNGKSLLHMEFKKRRELLEKIVREEKGKIVLSKMIVTESKKEVEDFFKKSVKAGNEGLMLKALDAPYKPGARVGYMLKFKAIMDTLDLVIVKAEWGEGKRSSWLSSFTLACYNDGEFLEVGKASTGLKEKKEEGLSFDEMTKLLKPLVIEEKGKEAIVKPKIVLEIGYEEIQKSPTYASGFALRFPRVVGLRDDRKAEDASTLDLVKKFYEGQKKK